MRELGALEQRRIAFGNIENHNISKHQVAARGTVLGEVFASARGRGSETNEVCSLLIGKTRSLAEVEVPLVGVVTMAVKNPDLLSGDQGLGIIETL